MDQLDLVLMYMVSSLPIVVFHSVRLREEPKAVQQRANHR
jgi:hypothetical protein